MFPVKRLERIEALQQRIYDLQDQMHEQLRDINIALIVREPGTARAAEAYEGLRKSVATAARERRQHLAQLVEFADAIDRGASVDTLRQRCEQWCLEAGLERRSDVVPEWFSVVEGEGPVLEVMEPAWVDSSSGQLVKQGTARRLPGEIALTPETIEEAPEAIEVDEAEGSEETPEADEVEGSEETPEADEAEETAEAEDAVETPTVEEDGTGEEE